MAEKRAWSRNKVRRFGAEKGVDPIRLKGGTLPEACGAFEAFTGERIGRDTMCRHNRRLRAAVEKMRMIERLVDRVIEREREEGALPGENLAALARRLLLTQAVEAAAGLPAEAMESLSADKLARLVAQLEKSGLDAERQRLQYERGCAAARKAVFAQLEEELRDHPALWKQLREVALKALVETEEGAG